MVSLLVNIDVEALDPAVCFYCDAFGFHVGRRLGPKAVELLGAGVPVYLLEKPAGSPAHQGAASSRQYDRHWTPVHLDVVVDDLDAALQRAVQCGARAETPIREHDWGRIVVLADPFGHGICLLQFTDRGYDAIAES